METIIVKERGLESFWIEITKENGQVEREQARGARAGLSWPSPGSPGFYVILGQLYKTLPNGKHPLRILKEGSNHIVNSLFQELVDNIAEFNGYEIFSDVSFRYQNYVQDFWRFHQDRRLQDIKLLSAPFFQSFGHGVYLIKEWIGDQALYIPEGSVAKEQLKRLEEHHLKENPEEEFFAVNALRFGLAAFTVSDWSPAKRTTSSKPLPRGAWT